MICRSIALLAIALVAAVAGCGDDGAGDGRGGMGSAAEEAASIEKTIVVGMGEIDPDACERLYTEEFRERLKGGAEEDGLQICEEKAEARHGGYPRQVIVSRVRIGGGHATADAAFKGGDNNGQTIRFALIHEEGRWKLDRMLEFVEYDRAELLKGIRREVREFEKHGLEPELGACLVEEMEGLEEDDLKEMSLFNDLEPAREVAEGCEEQLGPLDL